MRLELAGTPEFPGGSASRAYLMRLPIGENGMIDEISLAEMPSDATVRRFWPNEADRVGRVVRTESGWAVAYEQEGAALCRIEADPIRLGGQLRVTEADGRRLPFRVASLKALA